MKTSRFLCGCLILAFGASVWGQQGIAWNDDPSEWAQIQEQQGKVSKGTIDFDDDPDYGVVGFAGPLTSAGAGPVNPGVVLDNVVIDSVNGRNYSTNMAAFGPSFGWGNASNGIVASYFTDSLQIELTEPNHSMLSLNHWTIPGGPTVDVSFFDENDALIDTVVGIASPATGHDVLYWAEDRTVSISRIVVHDPDSGAEGVMQMEFWIPEPATLSLLTIGGLAAMRRRTC